MEKLVLISKLGGVATARKVLASVLEQGCTRYSTVILDDGFSFHLTELEEALADQKFDYWDGIVIGSFGGTSRLILSNYHGYLGAYWGYRSFRPTRKLKSIQDLNNLKSDAINHGAKMDWGTFQWVLNNFEMLIEQSEAVT